MDKAEAKKILADQLSRFNRYDDALRFAESGHVEDFEVRGSSGTIYQIEVNFFWDDRRKRVVRAVGSIDDGGIRALMPLTETLLISPPEISA